MYCTQTDPKFLPTQPKQSIYMPVSGRVVSGLGEALLLVPTFQLVANWWFGLVVWDSRDASTSNVFHKGILTIQTTNPKNR